MAEQWHPSEIIKEEPLSNAFRCGSRWHSPMAIFVRPGRSMRVRFTTEITTRECMRNL